MTVVINGEEQALAGFIYVGSLPMGFLWTDEQATPTGDGNGACVITSPRGPVRLRVGDLINRLPDGSLFTTATHPQDETVGFTYDGSFPASFLRNDEIAHVTGNGKYCIVASPRGSTRISPGAFISRRGDGSLFTTSSPDQASKGSVA